MEKSEVKIFYSWQSDLPGSDTRNLIQDSIKDTVRILRDTVEIDADRDTKGEYGAPDIVQTIFSKIDECDIFIADVSAVCEYHPLDKDGNLKEETKLTPNPNVLMELGYAAHVVGWENIICVINTDYGDPQRMPFDIAHRRLTPYSLKSKTKGEVKRSIRDIIQGTVENLVDNGKRVKSGLSNIQVGSYDLETKKISKTLIPWNLRESSTFLAIKQSLVEECMILIEEIEKNHLPMLQHSDETPNEQLIDNKQEPIVTKDRMKHIPLDRSLQLNLFNTNKVEISREDIDSIVKLAKEYLDYDIDIQSDFFYVGNLKKRTTIAINVSYELEGTDDEKKKYDDIYQLESKLYLMIMWEGYLDTFDGMVFLPLVVKNESTVADQDINISIKVNTDLTDIILPTVELFNSEMIGLEGNIYEEGIIKKLLMMPETTEIRYDTDISFSIEDMQSSIKSVGFIGGVNGMPRYDSEDYARELSKFIAKPISGRMSEFSFNINSLHAQEKKWIGPALLLKPIDGAIEITYSVKSQSSDGNLSGTLMY